MHKFPLVLSAELTKALVDHFNSTLKRISDQLKDMSYRKRVLKQVNIKQIYSKLSFTNLSDKINRIEESLLKALRIFSLSLSDQLKDRFYP